MWVYINDCRGELLTEAKQIAVLLPERSSRTPTAASFFFWKCEVCSRLSDATSSCAALGTGNDKQARVAGRSFSPLCFQEFLTDGVIIIIIIIIIIHSED
jgi:hypothetical protein